MSDESPTGKNLNTNDFGRYLTPIILAFCILKFSDALANFIWSVIRYVLFRLYIPEPVPENLLKILWEYNILSIIYLKK